MEETFEQKLRNLISQDEIDNALNEFDSVIVQYQNTVIKIDEETNNLHNELTMLIRRNNSLNREIRMGTKRIEDIEVERNNIVKSLLDLITSLANYSLTQEYLINLVEIESWRKVKLNNTISSYQNFLEKYPNGEYVREANLQIERLQTQKLESEIINFLNRYSNYYFSPSKIKNNQLGHPLLNRYSSNEIRKVLNRLKVERIVRAKISDNTGNEIFKIR